MIAVILKKELKGFFTSATTYVIAALFAGIMGWIFFNLLIEYIETHQNVPNGATQWNFINSVVMKVFGNLNFLLLFISPIMTMRLFAEEKRESTLDLFFASPVKDYQLVIAKYLASVVMGGFLLATTFTYPVLMSAVSLEDFSFVFCGYLAIMLNICCFFGIGMVASSITSNQIVSAFLTLVVIMMFWMITWVSKGSSNFMLVQITNYLSMNGHFESVAKGVISISDFVYYASFIWLSIFTTKKIISSRNW